MTRSRTHQLAALGLLAVLAFAAQAATAHTGGGLRASAADTAVVAQGVDPTTMDPHQQRETTTLNVLRHIYDPLVARNGADPTRFDGILARSWKRVGPKVMRFTLRRKASPSATARRSTHRQSSTTSTASSGSCRRRSRR